MRRIEHQHIAFLGEALLVSIQTAIELRKLRILAKGFCVDTCCLSIALTLDLLGIAVGIGNGDVTLTVGLGANLFTLSRACGAQLVGHALALGLHTAIDGLGDGLGIVHASDAHIDDVDTPGLGAAHGFQHFTLDVGHQRFTLGRQQLTHGTAVDLFLKGIAHHTVELHGTGRFIQTHITDVFRRLGDAPAHIPVDDHTLLFSREHGLGIGAVERQQTLVDVTHVLQRWRQLEVKPGLGDHFLDLTQRIDHTELTLIHDKQGRAQQGQHHENAGDKKSDSIHCILS